MKIPKKIKVGAIDYEVKVVMPDHPKLDNDRNQGVYSVKEGAIFLANDMPKGLIEKAFLHEILHAININLDEITVESLAGHLYQVLKDNKLHF